MPFNKPTTLRRLWQPRLPGTFFNKPMPPAINIFLRHLHHLLSSPSIHNKQQPPRLLQAPAFSGLPHPHPLSRLQPRPRHPKGRRGAITCSLTVLRERTLRRLLPAQFTGDQWKYYWGITESDRFGKIYEAASATFFGLWMSWFLTFLIGLPASTVLGTVRLCACACGCVNRRPVLPSFSGVELRPAMCTSLPPKAPLTTTLEQLSDRCSSSTGSWPRAWRPTAAT